MVDTNVLFDIAEKENVKIYYGDIEDILAMSVPNAICINIGLFCRTAQERVCLAHELGHCVNDAFYNRFSPIDERSKHEAVANKWAIKKLVPKDELETAFRKGCQNTYELAEYFGVTEDFIRIALEENKKINSK